MRRKPRTIKLPPPYLRRVWLDPLMVAAPRAYPFSLQLFHQSFDLEFERPITILVGENGAGKSTLLEGIAALCGFDESGGGKGYRTVDHSRAVEKNGGLLATAFRASWLPKITSGWFFRAESFFSVARYLDQAALDVHAPPPNFLSHSHGEGFLKFLQGRCEKQGLYIFDEPESALSPSRQVEFLRSLRRMEQSRICQVIMATHSPLLMAYPDAQLLRLSANQIKASTVRETEHYLIMEKFYENPTLFMSDVLASESCGSHSR